MADRPDFKELLRMLNEGRAEYLIVGGYAIMKYTEQRFTNLKCKDSEFAGKRLPSIQSARGLRRAARG